MFKLRFNTFFIFHLIICWNLQAESLSFLDFARSASQHEGILQPKYALRLVETIPVELQNLTYAVYPNDETYNTRRFNYNKRFNLFPKAIFIPTTPEEAQYVLANLKKYQLPFSIRSGGHCFESGSLSSDFIFDLREFNSIIPDLSQETVYVGAGCLLNQVISTLGSLNYAIPTGTCPDVCVTGLTLGGGIGLLTRQYGLTCDSVKSITLLNANAEIIEVNEQSYPDLFWALRGGGNGSYGIVLGFVFKIHAVPVTSFFELSWPWKTSRASKIIRAWQNWAEKLSSTISTSIRLEYKEGVTAIRIIGIKVGQTPFTEWEETFGAFNPLVTIYQGPYIDTVKYWSAQPSLPFNKIKSKILIDPLSKKVVHKIVKFLHRLDQDKPNLRLFLNLDAFGGNVPNVDTAFAFRKAFGWWYQAVYWPLQTQEEQAIDLIRTIYDETSKDVSKFSYANATDYDLKKHYLKAYYGKNVERLIQIKRMYDPENIFHWHQSIPLSH